MKAKKFGEEQIFGVLKESWDGVATYPIVSRSGASALLLPRAPGQLAMGRKKSPIKRKMMIYVRMDQ
jgi:hypothetical protein